jgi:NAD dependent epimerase/dehydratase family enzyme
MVLGEMAEELLLASIRVIPEKLLASGYQFQWEDLEITLRQQLRHT